MKLHPLQIKLLSLAEEDMLSGLSLREIGGLVGESHPQKIKYHMEKLEEKGLIYIDQDSGQIEFLRQEQQDSIQIPVYGMAQCGQGNLFADDTMDDIVSFPTKLLGRYQNNVFATQAVGNSMYPKINNGDFVIVEHQITFEENKVCLVLADGDPRIKQVMTLDNRHIALKSFNDEFETQILKSSDVQILGIVRKVVSEI